MLGRLGHLDVGLVLFQPLGLLVFYQRGAPLLAHQHVVFGPGRLVVGLGVVVLLPGHRLLGIELLVAVKVGLGLVQPDAQLFDVGIRYGEVVGRGRDDGLHGTVLHEGLLIVGFGLHHLEPVFRTLDDDERVALVHELEIVEAYFLDISLHSRIDGDDVAPYLGIVGVFDPSEMDKPGADPAQPDENDGNHDDVATYFFSSLVHTLFICLWGVWHLRHTGAGNSCR